ncbi:hypothetical protein ACFOWE_24350 [Planomonospora corallina]|uniref:Uncharacterized protein n=1 Tax=Planomonospora corallina TaxID=1806052 RepID=A0ABV8IC38_9ACTN
MYMPLGSADSGATAVWVGDGGVVLYGPDGAQSATFIGRGGHGA